MYRLLLILEYLERRKLWKACQQQQLSMVLPRALPGFSKARTAFAYILKFKPFKNIFTYCPRLVGLYIET
jgi:hypothetical protein